MIKKLLLTLAMLASMAAAWGQVEVNKADAAALDSIRGLGPAKTRLILDERNKGEFKDWADLEQRVKGIGPKSALKLSQAGLQVNGKSKDGAPMAADKPAKSAKTAK